MTAVIFGVSGQDGNYLSGLLASNGIEVTGVSRTVNSEKVDISDFDSVNQFISDRRPDFIFHFAAESSTKHSTIFKNYQSITTGTLNILEAVKNNSPHTKVFISGSGLQFKNDGLPINESTAFEGRDIYSVCRIQSVYTARYYRQLGIKVYVGYFFNHDSPLRSERHMTKKIAEAAKRIVKGSKEKIEIGDLKSIKEYSFAGDIVNAVWVLVSQENIYEVVIGSGIGYSIEEWVDACFSIIGMEWNNYIIPNPNFVPDYNKLISDPSLMKSLNWRPHVSFAELAKMMME